MNKVIGFALEGIGLYAIAKFAYDKGEKKGREEGAMKLWNGIVKDDDEGFKKAIDLLHEERSKFKQK
jgi:hypothetical protein